MSKLIIDTKKSLFEPIEVEIDGISYPVTSLTKAVFDELKKFEKAALEGNLDALYGQLQALIPKLDGKVLATLDIRDVRRIINHITQQVFRTDKTVSTEEKNESRSGPTK